MLITLHYIRLHISSKSDKFFEVQEFGMGQKKVAFGRARFRESGPSQGLGITRTAIIHVFSQGVLLNYK